MDLLLQIFMSIRDLYIKHKTVYTKDEITAFLDEFRNYC